MADSTRTSRPAQADHYRFLDLLRFVAAGLVLAYHYAFRGWAADEMSAVRFDSLGGVARFGFFGVHLFFIISGFVIAASAERRTAAQFARARVRRLYPAFWVACALTAAASLLFRQPQYAVTWTQLAANLTLFAAELRQPYVDGAYWSLTTEIHFYALVAAVLAVGAVRRLNLVLLAWLGLSVLNLLTPVPAGWLLSLTYAPLFVAGAAYLAIARRVARWPEWVGLAAALPASAAYAMRDAHDITLHFRQPVSPVICALLVLTFHALFLAVTLRRADLPRWRILPVLGGVTYPLYLIHQNVGFMALNASAGRVPRYVALAAVTTGVLATAWAIYAWAEPPMRRGLDGLLARLTRRRHAAVVPARGESPAPVSTDFSLLETTEARLRAPRRTSGEVTGG